MARAAELIAEEVTLRQLREGLKLLWRTSHSTTIPSPKTKKARISGPFGNI